MSSLPNNVDLIIPTRRGMPALIKLLTEASDPKWSGHTFCFVFDSYAEQVAEELRKWLNDHRDMLLPKVKACFAPANFAGNLNALRQIGLTQGENPFVYFQDDDDPLPQGLDVRLRMMQGDSYDAIFGVTETRTARGQMIEHFPSLDSNGQPLYDLVQGLRLFPTYAHPCAALYRRSVFDTTPIDDGISYTICGVGGFLARFMANGARITTLSDIIRIGCQSSDNMSIPILDQQARLLLAEDISLWQRYIESPEVRNFQEEIRQDLIHGDIITFRDITARVEAKLEEDMFLGVS